MNDYKVTNSHEQAMSMMKQLAKDGDEVKALYARIMLKILPEIHQIQQQEEAKQGGAYSLEFLATMPMVANAVLFHAMPFYPDQDSRASLIQDIVNQVASNIATSSKIYINHKQRVSH